MYILLDIRKADVSGKRVFLRADTDVPLREFKVQSEKFKVDIEDDTRLKAWFPTLEYLLQHNAKVIIGGKLGRPEGKIDQSLSLRPVAEWILQKLKTQNSPARNATQSVAGGNVKATHSASSGRATQNVKLNGFNGWEISSNVFLLENLQFYPQEKGNDPEFAKKLASLADIYVNDAFAVSHRNHASVVGVPKLLPHFSGLRLQKEIQVLSSILESPNRPLIVIVGGAKIETKKPLVSKMLDLADSVLVGGLIAAELKEPHPNLIVAGLNNEGTDITDETIDKFINIIKTAKTVVWNGPVGKISNVKSSAKGGSASGGQMSNVQGNSERGTREIAKAVIQSSAYKVVGGGDTIDFLRRTGLIDKFDFVSMGGGAMLSFLSGEEFSGLEVLGDKNAS